jgi:DNA-binding transcriptional regulator YhcF (GntR family)
MQIYKQKEGIVIQIKKTNRKKGDKTLSMTVYGEDLNIAFGRIQDLYENLAKYEEINIRHKR